MKPSRFELRTIAIPRVRPFRTSLGVQDVHEGVLVRVDLGDAEGWGECVAEEAPTYCPEYAAGAADVIRRFFVPKLATARTVEAADVAPLLAEFRGHQMAKSALEMAVLDAQLRSWGVSLAKYLGGVRAGVPAGVSVGIMDDVAQLLDEVAQHLSAGYRRIKLKIEPGWDVEPVRAVRERFGPDVVLQVDANTAYTRADIRHLAALDEYDLLLVEQPYAPDDLLGHAELARRLATPICLDESITSAASAATAVTLGACSIINVKPGRVGGYLEARRIHDLARAHGIPVWCGGMAETGLGRAGNAALAALPGFTLAGDISATERYYVRDVTPPFVLEDGHIVVPTGPGLGVEPQTDALEEFTVSTEVIDL